MSQWCVRMSRRARGASAPRTRTRLGARAVERARTSDAQAGLRATVRGLV
ncbi:hypothetical protein [Halorussus caseinilyticus]|nr:hypothetical protein [Halorussus sp. DT72]